MEPTLPAFRSLEQVVRWALERDAPVEPVAMDEFTFDVVVPLGPGRVLVFDTT